MTTADRIVTAERADRTPNWNKRPLIPNLAPWQCAALWTNIDPDKVKLIDHAWMADGSIHRFDESQDFKDKLELVEANQYGALKSDGRSSYTVDLRLFAAWVREIGWPAPPELLAIADGRDPGKQNASTPAKENANVERRAQNKQVTQDRYHAWQRASTSLPKIPLAKVTRIYAASSLRVLACSGKPYGAIPSAGAVELRCGSCATCAALNFLRATFPLNFPAHTGVT